MLRYNATKNDLLYKNGWRYYHRTGLDAKTGKFHKGVSHLKKPIVVARDIIGFDGKSRKMFLGLDSYEELLDLTINDNNIFEVATCGEFENITQRLPYVDIDENKKDPITESDMKVVVQEFIEEFNEEIKENRVSITEDDVIILLNNDYKTELVKSLHLIVMGYSMDFLQQRQLITNIAFKRDGEGKTERYDKSQYSHNQQVRMTNQSKNDGNPNNYTLVVYGDDIKKNNPRNALIHHPLNCKKLKYSKTLTQKQKQIYSSTGKEQVNIIKGDRFSSVLDKLDSNFWDKTGYWKLATWIIKSKNLMNIDKWEFESRERATNNYTKESNDQLIKDIPDVVESGIPKLLNIFTASSSKYYFTMEYDRWENDKILLQDYITKHDLPIEISKLTECLSKNKKLTLHNEQYDINLSNGFITDKVAFTTNNFKHNFTDDEDLYETTDIEHISEIDVDKIINSKNKLQLFRSAWATGKSHAITRPIVERLCKNVSFLIPTSLNTINNKLRSDYKEYNVVSHLDNGDMLNCNIVICSVQSIHRLAGRVFNYIILDEFEAVYNAFAGDNFGSEAGKTAVDCFNHFIKKCKDADKIICLDADLNGNRLKLFADATDYKDELKIINNKQNNYSDYTFEIIKDKQEFIADIEKQIEAGKSVVVSTSVRVAFGDVVFADWCVKYPDRNICYINRDGVDLSPNLNATEDDKNEFIQNLEDNLKVKYKIDIWIYSPTISIGISINTYKFDCGFAYGFHLTLPALEFLQSFFRVRELNDKHITILLEPECWTSAVPISTDQMRYYIDNKVKTYSKYYDEYYKITQTIDEHYIRMFCYSKTLQENSRRNFGREVVKLLEAHNLNYVFRCDAKKVKKLESSYAEMKLKLEEEKMNEYNNQSIGNHKFHSETKIRVKAEQVKSSKDDKTIKLTKEEQLKYTKTNNTFYLDNTHSFIDIISNHENPETEVDVKAFIYSCNSYGVKDYDEDGVEDDKKEKEDKYEKCKLNAYLHSTTDELNGKTSAERIKIVEDNMYSVTINNIELDTSFQHSFSGSVSSYDRCKNIAKVIESRRTYALWTSLPSNQIDEQLSFITTEQSKTEEISNGNRIKIKGFLLNKLLCILKCKNFTPIVITNIQFRGLIVDYKDLIKEIYNLFLNKFSKKDQDKFADWIDNYNNTTNSAIDKKNVKMIYHSIKELLDEYDLGMCYANKHTYRDNDKIIIQPKNEVVDYGGSRINIYSKTTRHFTKREIIEIDCRNRSVCEMFYVKRLVEDDVCSAEEYKLSADKEHLIVSKLYGQQKRPALFKEKKEVFALDIGRKSSVDNVTGIITYDKYGCSYRPYKVKINKKTLELRNRIETRNLSAVLESIKNLNCISKMNLNRIIKVNKHLDDPSEIFKKWNEENTTLVELNRELLGDLDMSWVIRKDFQEEYDTQLDNLYHDFIIMRCKKSDLTGRQMWDKTIDKVVGNTESDADKEYTKYTDADRKNWELLWTYTDEERKDWLVRTKYKGATAEPITIKSTIIKPSATNPQIIENNNVLQFLKNC